MPLGVLSSSTATGSSSKQTEEEPVVVVVASAVTTTADDDDDNQVSSSYAVAPIFSQAAPEAFVQRVKFTGDVPMGTSDAASASAAAIPYQHEPRRNASGMAIASLVCAIIGLVICVLGVLLGPIAICLAVAALKDIKEKPNQVAGKCMATSGLIIGIIAFIVSIIIIIVWSSPSMMYMSRAY